MDSNTLIALVCGAGAYAISKIFKGDDDDDLTLAAIVVVGVLAYGKMYDRK